MKNNAKLDNIYCKYRENKNSHVYLVETNSIDNALVDIKELIIRMNENNKENDIKKLIETDSLPTLSIIKPETLEIKIDVIEELIKKLQTIPVITKENYFIVCEAEKLNQKSGNSMLKIIEEPECDILGFFLCSNINNVMQTIQSRAQYISLIYDLSLDYSEEVILDAKKLFNNLHDQLSIVENKYFSEKYKSVNDFNELIDCLLCEYNKYINSLDNFDIIKKENKILNLILNFKSNINKNCNINLLLDKLVIEVGRL